MESKVGCWWGVGRGVVGFLWLNEGGLLRFLGGNFVGGGGLFFV